MKITCPVCNSEIEIDAAAELGKRGGSSTSDRKRQSSRENFQKAIAAGKKGGRPKGSKNKKKEE